jgi:hypothetical protein
VFEEGLQEAPGSQARMLSLGPCCQVMTVGGWICLAMADQVLSVVDEYTAGHTL